MELYQHQKDALDFLSQRKFAWLQYEMGLGKTIILLKHLEKHLDTMRPILIVSPKNVVPVWGGEIEKFGIGIKVTELAGTTLNKISGIKEDSDLFVINYESLRLVSPHLLSKKFKTIILDESHRIKDRSAKQTQVCHLLAKIATFRYALTGTPTPKGPEDIWSQCYFLHPNILPNFYVFGAQYVAYKKITINTPKGKREIRKPLHVRPSKETELRSKLDPYVLRRTKVECLDLPSKIYKRIEVEMTVEQKRAYSIVRGDLKKLFESNELNQDKARGSIHKLQQIAQGFMYDDKKQATFFDSCKINALNDLLEDLEGKKVLLFTWYKADIEAIKNAVKDRDILIYDGSDENRKEIIRKFQNDDVPYIFLTNIERAKEGITLTAASDVIYFGNSYSYGSRVQSEDRVHRTGQKNVCVYYDIITKNTVDERVTKILLDKKEMADAITGDSIRLAKMELMD